MEEKKKRIINSKTLGKQDLDNFVLNPAVDWENIKMTFVAGGQGGGKIAAEFCRLGYPLVAYNTSKEDLEDLTKMIEKMPEESRGKFETIELPGEGGASKDRDLGYQAIEDNLPILQEEMFENKEIRDADFVWLVVTLGGGTGNGSLAFVTKILNLIRQEKIVKRGGVARPTVGIIAAIPDSRITKSKIAANVALAISEIEQMHDNLEVGAVVLVDNKKLVDDFNEKYMNIATNKEWSEDGNAKVARIITETALLTCLPGSQVLDKSELLEIWTSPGYLNIGKRVIKKGWIEQYLDGHKNDKNYKSNENKEDSEESVLDKYVGLTTDQLTGSDKKKIFGQLVKDSFEDNIFVSGLELESAIHGAMVVMTDGDVISTKDANILENSMSEEVLTSDAVEATHYAFLRNDKYLGTVRHPKKKIQYTKEGDKKTYHDGRIFTMCVTYTPPEYMIEWFKKAKAQRERNESAIKNLNKRKSQLADIVAGLDANSKVTKKSNEDIATSLSNLISSKRGLKSTTKGSASKISLNDLIKDSKGENGSSSENKAVSRKDELAAQIREKIGKQN